MQKRNVLNSPHLSKLKKHRRRVILDKILILLLGLLSIFFSAVYLSGLNSLNINNIEISGNKVVDTETIKTIVEQQLAGKYFGLFPKTNILFYPQNKIKNALQNQIKRLQDINLSLKNNNILQISVYERTPEYLWCGENLPSLGGGLPANSQAGIGEGSEQCYFMDENGYIFDEAPYFSGEVYFKFYGSIQNFKQLVSFNDILIGLGLKPISLFITNDGDIQIFLSGSSLAATPKIILRANADFEKVAENLETALSTEPLQSEFKNKYSSLQYIDLRFGNKVYYKFQ
jgi:cell division septal protein FtsQ